MGLINSKFNIKTIEQNLLIAVEQNDIEKVKKILENANENNIILKINEIKNKYDNYLYFESIHKNNIEIVKLLFNYAIKNSIILDINNQNKYGNYPILEAIICYNINIKIYLMNMLKKRYYF